MGIRLEELAEAEGWRCFDDAGEVRRSGDEWLGEGSLDATLTMPKLHASKTGGDLRLRESSSPIVERFQADGRKTGW